MSELLKRVADKTTAEKYAMPDFVFDVFGRKENGAFVKDHYLEMAEKYTYLDMRYESFDWQNGVGYFGLMKANEILRDDQYMEFFKEWVDFHIQKGLPPKTINSTAPFLSVLELYKKYGEEKYRALCEENAEFCMAEGARADEGTLEHTVMAKNRMFESQIWADTAFMAGIFLSAWGQFTGKRMFSKEAARQIILHYKYLTDQETGLMFHAYSCKNRNHLSGVKWGRANGWGVISSVEILERLPQHLPEREIIIENLKNHIDRICQYQAPGGGWHTVLDDPDTYIETTAACAFYYGIRKAVKKGYIPDGYTGVTDQALAHIKENVGQDGQMLKTSSGTPVMCSAEEYNKIPCTMSYYGQGLGMMALSAE